MKRTRRKKRRELVTRRIIYMSSRRPHDQPLELKVDVPRGDEVDADYAAAMVAARTTMPLAEVQIIDIVTMDKET